MKPLGSPFVFPRRNAVSELPSPDGGHLLSAISLCIFAVVSSNLAGCAATAHSPPRLSSEFVGVWANAIPAYHNWWEISPGKVVNFGIGLDHGICVGRQVNILGPNEIEVPSGDAGTATLRIDDGALLLEWNHARALHVRVPRDVICKDGDTYFEGAPYPGAAATVNGRLIRWSLFDYYARSVLGKPPGQLTAVQRSKLLDDLILQEVVAQEAEREGLDHAEGTASLVSTGRPQIPRNKDQGEPHTDDLSSRSDLEALRILGRAVAAHYASSNPASDAELRVEYNAEVALTPTTQYHARHILVESRQQAEDIIQRFVHGEDFDHLARTYSLDSFAKDGGDLGWAVPSNLIKPLADAVVELTKGAITYVPIQSQFGWSILQLLDTRATPIPPFDQVQERISKSVEEKKLQPYKDQLLRASNIT